VLADQLGKTAEALVGKMFGIVVNLAVILLAAENPRVTATAGQNIEGIDHIRPFTHLGDYAIKRVFIGINAHFQRKILNKVLGDVIGNLAGLAVMYGHFIFLSE